MRIADYDVIGVSHEGNHGTYYRARPPERLGISDPEVVLKVLGRRATDDEFKRFANEMRLLNRLDSPYLAKLLDAGSVDGEVFMATRRYEASLNEAAALADDDAVRATVELVADAARGAHALHEMGVAHRDIRPSNVLIDRPDGRRRGRLGDLGLAEMGPGVSATIGTGPIGSLGYMAPEVVAEGNAGRGSDVWSLGATLHAALSDRPLFGEIPDRSVLDALRHLARTTPRVDDRLDSAVTDVIGQCLADRTERFPTANDLAIELDRVATTIGATT
ncbi:MAG: protein kinase [Actinomycetota bacterium]